MIAGAHAGGQGEPVMERRASVPATRPTNAPWPVVRRQNMPSAKVAKSGALTKAKTSCSRSMMLLNAPAT